MIPSIHNRLFGPGGCLTASALEAYINGSLRLTARMKFEEHVKICSICAEALEGFKRYGRAGYLRTDVEFLTRRIRKKYTGRLIHERRVPVLILLSLTTFLLLFLGVFYILRQNTALNPGLVPPLTDTIHKETKAQPDTSAFRPSGAEDTEKEDKR